MSLADSTTAPATCLAAAASRSATPPDAPFDPSVACRGYRLAAEDAAAAAAPEAWLGPLLRADVGDHSIAYRRIAALDTSVPADATPLVLVIGYGGAPPFALDAGKRVCLPAGLPAASLPAPHPAACHPPAVPPNPARLPALQAP